MNSAQRTVGFDPTSYPPPCNKDIKDSKVADIKELLTASLKLLYNSRHSLFDLFSAIGSQ